MCRRLTALLLALLLPLVVYAQNNLTVSGNVVDELDMPIISATVVVVGQSNKGALTDLDGNFTIMDILPNSILRISYVGYKTQEIPLNGETKLRIKLIPDSEVLDEVVVTALGIKRSEKALSYNVQEIKSDVLTTAKDANFINSLNGRVAGVQINKSGSGIGGASRVVMRGTKSVEGSNSVLYVVDGMPLFNTSVGADSGTMGEGRVGSEGIADFNPEDIASISILSGPSAAALYGSSAANGAILITTKTGEEGKAKVTLSSSYEFSHPFVMPRFQNRYGNKEGSFESWGDKLATPSTYNPAVDFFRTGSNLINSISLSTGTETNQTYLSVATTNAGGIVPNNNYDRYNFAVNNHTQLLNGMLELTLGAQYIKQKDRNMVSQGQYWNPIVAAYLFPRGEDFQDIQTFERWDEGRKIAVQYWPISENVYGVQNPYWTAYRNVSENSKDRYIFNAGLKYNILDWMNLSGRFRMDKSNSRFTRKLYASTNEKWAKDKGYYSVEQTADGQYYGDVMLNINKLIGDWSLTSNVGGSYSDYSSLTEGNGGNLQLVPNLFAVNNMSDVTPIETGGDTPVRNFALFASLELGWKNMLYLTATGRNDWNSRLVNSSEPSFFYPSIGLSAILSEIFEMGPLVDLIKVRGSFTEVGSPVSKIGLTPGTYTDDIKGGILIPNQIFPYGDFKAERTRSFEVGLSAKAVHGLFLELTYYKSNTYNQTFLGDMPKGSGYTQAYLQAGNVENRGIEASLGYDHSWADFSFGTSLVYSRNVNEIKEMVKDYKHPKLPNQTFNIDQVTKGGNVILKVGGSMNDMYATQFLKKDGNGFIYIPETGTYGEETKEPVFIGRNTPDFNLGWNTYFSYKGVSLGLLFNGRFGGVVTSTTQAIMDKFGVSEASAIARDNGGYMIPNQGMVDAKTFFGLIGDGKHHAYYTYDATNVRLQQLTLSWRMPNAWFKDYIRGLNLTFSGNNLWMLYNKAPHDPELTPTTGTYGVGNDYFMQPSLRSFNFGIKLEI